MKIIIESWVVLRGNATAPPGKLYGHFIKTKKETALVAITVSIKT